MCRLWFPTSDRLDWTTLKTQETYYKRKQGATQRWAPAQQFVVCCTIEGWDPKNLWKCMCIQAASEVHFAECNFGLYFTESNLHSTLLRIPSKSWSCGPWLRVSYKHFMRHFTLPPPLGGHHLVGSFIQSTALDGSGLAQVWFPLFLHFRTWWGTQAISQHSWVSLDIPCRTNFIRKDSGCWWNPENTYLQISDFGNRTRAARLVVK